MSTRRPEQSPSGSAGGRSLRLAALIVLFLLPLALRLRPIAHGQPRNYVPDTHVVRCALGMARDKDPVPPVNRYSSYPYLLPYLLLPLYAGHFALGYATGEWSGPSEYGAALSEDPAPAHLIARVLVALFGALTPWVVFRTARAAGLERGAWVAAWLVGTGLLHTHFSVQERPWVPMVFFLALAAWPGVLYVRDARARLLALSCLAAGLSLGAHTGGALAFGIPGLAWLQVVLAARGRELLRHIARGAACVAAGVALAIVLGHPYLLVHGPTPADAVVGGGEGDLSLGGQSHRVGFRLASLTRLSRAFAGYDPALVLLALPGLVLSWRARSMRPLTLFALLWAAYFLPQQNDQVRYLLPLSVLLAIPAGLAAERWLARGPAWLPALALLLALPLVQDLRLGHLLARPDTRASAEAIVPGHLPPGAVLAVDRYGPLFEPSLASLERLAALRAAKGEELSTRERHRAERLRAEGSDAGLDLLAVQEIFDTDERAGTVWLAPALAGHDPRQPRRESTLEELRKMLQVAGATHLLLVGRAPPDASGSLLAGLVEGSEPLLVVDPARPGARPAEARLPTEMEFPLTNLWRVQRPGPWMGLYALR